MWFRKSTVRKTKRIPIKYGDLVQSEEYRKETLEKLSKNKYSLYQCVITEDEYKNMLVGKHREVTRDFKLIIHTEGFSSSCFSIEGGGEDYYIYNGDEFVVNGRKHTRADDKRYKVCNIKLSRKKIKELERKKRKKKMISFFSICFAAVILVLNVMGFFTYLDKRIERSKEKLEYIQQMEERNRQYYKSQEIKRLYKMEDQ